MIQASLLSLCVSRLLLNVNTFTNPERYFLFGFHSHRPFCSHALLLHGSTWGVIIIGCLNRYTRTWHPWQRSTSVLKHHDSQRVHHVHPKSRLMQLTMNPRLHSGNLVDLVSPFVLSTLKFLSPWPVISLLPQLYFEDGKDSYYVVVDRSSVYIYSRMT